MLQYTNLFSLKEGEMNNKVILKTSINSKKVSMEKAIALFEINVYYIKCLKRKKDGKINLYSYCIDCGFKNFETIDKKELSYLLESLI